MNRRQLTQEAIKQNFNESGAGEERSAYLFNKIVYMRRHFSEAALKEEGFYEMLTELANRMGVSRKQALSEVEDRIQRDKQYNWGCLQMTCEDYPFEEDSYVEDIDWDEQEFLDILG